MTRRMVYGFGLWLTLGCTAMTLASIIMPRWVSYSPNDTREISYGLHRRCRVVEGVCTHFPQSNDCVGDKWSFCSMWRTVGFLISLAVVIQLCTLVAFAVIIICGVQRRSTGWKIVCSLLGLGGIVQCVGMALVSFLFDNDERFFEGWYLDNSWILCTTSWAVMVLTSIGIVGTAMYLPTEGGYELIPNYNSGYDVEVEEDQYPRGYQDED